MCGSGTNLNVHHISYEHLDTYDEIDDLITLCRDCHKKVHERDLQRKAEQIPEGQNNNSLFQLALKLLRTPNKDRASAWSQFEKACAQSIPPVSASECTNIWFGAVRIVDNWGSLW